MIGLGALCVLAARSAPAEMLTWTNSSGTNWFEAANWTPSQVPAEGDDVVLDGAFAPAGGVILSNDTAWLSSFTITNATLVFTNWTTTLRATNVTIRNQGVLTLPPAFEDGSMSNRVHIICENIHLEEGGKIDAADKGYASDNGPGRGSSSNLRAGGGGHGGHGGMGGHYLAFGGSEYDVLREPVAPGSGGGTGSYGGIGGSGGGAVRIEASSQVTVNGAILVDGEDAPYRGGGGSGGAIFIACATFGGGANGLLAANGGTQNHLNGSGGGGRIAVNYATLSGTPHVRFSAAPGGTEVFNPLTQWFKTAEMGTLFLPDLALLSEDLTDGRFNGVRLHTDGVLEWSVDSLSVSDTSLRLADDGVRVLVTNDIEILSGGALGIGANDALLFASLTCGGNLVVSNGAALSIYSGPTNGDQDHGALVSVENEFRIDDDSWIYPYSQDADGGSVLFRVRDLMIDATSGFNAEARGFRYGMGPGKGTASGYRGGGGGYGGVGGRGVNSGSYGGTTYGSAQAPIEPGSGSGVYHGFGGRGGGAIRVEASQRLVNDGQLVADGGDAHMHSGGGSGGGIFLRAAVLEGSGAIRADGGNGSANYSGGGGGGRIAVDTDIDRFTGETPGTYIEYGGAANDSISVLGSTVGYQPGTNGTFHLWRPLGTLFLVQ